MSDHVEVNYEHKCKCDKPDRQLVNYDMMWHDGDIICGKCDGFVRYYDAG